MIVLLAAVSSGIMFYLSQGFDSVWVLAWFAPVPLLWLAYGKAATWQVMSASAVAILASAGYLLRSPYLHLIPPLVFASALLLCGGLFCAAVWFARYVGHRTSPLLTLLAFPACGTAFEFLTELWSPNGTYGSLAYSTMAVPVLIQSASLLGMYAVTFLMGLFANTLAMALRPRREAGAAIGLGALLCAANVVFGFARLAQPQTDVVRVAGIVDETAGADSWRAHSVGSQVKVTATYADEIRQAAREGARFIVTPEGGMASSREGQSAIVAPLVAASRETGAQIVAGFHSEAPAADFALSISPDGRMQRYDKRHRVPGLEDRFTPGQTSGWLGDGRAVEICKDMDFPDTIRRDAAKRIRLAAVPAGDMGIDGWQHGIMSVMRGVENGFAMVRAAHDGLVFASDAQGRLVAVRKDAPAGPTMVIADLPLGPGPTLYTRIGNVFPWMCVIFSLALGAGLSSWRRLRGAARHPFFFRRALSGSPLPPGPTS
jgi:apolipoprotein N-acyltransferase